MSSTRIDKPTVLIVDDIAENIDVLKAALINDYTVRPALNGKIALRAATIHPYPDLILLDIMMPVMSGYEVCRRLKEDPATRNIPIIFVTAKSEIEDELEGLNIGAVDYITKPFSIPIIQARVRTHLALRAATQKLDVQNNRLLQERELIEKILLKMRSADTLDDRYLRYLIAPVEATAGDMLLSTFTPDGRQWVLLGDFTGHGLPAAIGGPLVTYLFYELAKRAYSGALLLEEINRQLCLRLPIGIFFAATMVEIAPDRKQAIHWNAGLPDTLLFNKDGRKTHLSSGMVPLGILKNLDIAGASTHVALEDVDRLYIFSDGVIESRGTHKTMFGLEKLEAFLEQVALSLYTLDDLITLIKIHTDSSVHEDDITLVEIQVSTTPA